MSNHGPGSQSPRRRSVYSGSAKVGSGSASSPPRAPGGRGRTYGGGRIPPVRQATKARMIVLACLLVSVFATIGGIGVWAYAKALNDDLDRFDAFEGLEDRPDETPGFNMLVLGTDSRNPDSDDPSRADTIMLMHVPSTADKAYIISLPRDLYVDVPAEGDWGGGETKLNSAQYHGGIPLMVNTVENYTGVFVDHVLQIDFDGLKEVVDALGGIDMDIEEATNPEYCLDSCAVWESIHKNPEGEYNNFEAGVEENMSGERALDYVRQRYQFADSDLSRMRHQQELLMAMMDKATTAGIVGNPGKMRSFLSSITDAVTVDEKFNLIDTGLRFIDIRSDDLTFMTSPIAGTEDRDGESVVIPDDEKAPDMYAAIAEDSLAGWLKENPDVAGEDETADGE
ncbi:MAG: LCP family protein [Stackebrandtia sp.]